MTRASKIVSAMLCIPVVAARASAEPEFSASFLSFPLAARSRWGAAGDFDADGYSDLAVAGTSGIALFFGGEGRRVFQRRADLPGGENLGPLAASDLDGDGRVDLASHRGLVLLGNGDGTFRPGLPFDIPQLPVGIVSTDLNRDGNKDLVVSSHFYDGRTRRGWLSSYLGNGDGTFGPRIETDVGYLNLPALALGHIDGDGIPDLAGVNEGLLVSLRGRTDGSFEVRFDSAPGDNGRLLLADLNADGRSDLVLAGGDLNVRLGTGDGMFGPARGLGIGGGEITALDANDDGRQDLLVSSLVGGAGARVLRGNGDGTFTEGALLDGGSAVVPLGASDFDGDGLADLAVAAADQGGYRWTLNVYLGNGDGTLGFRGTSAQVTTGRRPADVAARDLNGDGRVDLAVTDLDSNAVWVRLGRGNGEFDAAAAFPTGREPVSVVPGDLNGDGRLDLAVANRVSHTVSVLLGRGDGTFEERQDYSAGLHPESVAIGDLDSDGRPDLAVACSASRAVSILPGNGDGTFRRRNDVALHHDAFAVAVADLDGDGPQDLAVATVSGVDVVLGGAQGFSAPLLLPAGVFPRDVVVGDVTGDGLADIVVANAAPPEERADSGISVLAGRGDGDFQSALHIQAGADAAALAIGDLDLDFVPDIVTANASDRTVSVLAGRGDGTFEPHLDLGTGYGPIAVALADLNGGRRLEILTANTSSRTISVLFNRSIPVPVSIEDLQAGFADGSVRLRWSVSASAFREIRALKVQRSGSPAGPYSDVSAPLVPQGRMEFEDRDVMPGTSYWYRIALVTFDGGDSFSRPVAVQTGETGIVLRVRGTPGPGPIDISYAVESPATSIVLALHDVRGRLLQTLVRGAAGQGVRHVVWQRRDASGARAVRGVYFVSLRAGDKAIVRRLVLASG